MPETYTTAAGETRTTCGQHRTLGYALRVSEAQAEAVQPGTWVCRGCGLPEAQHETTDETVARRRSAA